MAYGDSTHRFYEEIQRHMLETTIDDGVTWSLWTATEVQNYLNHRIYRFLRDTGILYSIATQATTASDGDYALPATMITLRRVTHTVGSTVATLDKLDAFLLDHAQPGWHDDEGTPYGFVLEPRDSLTILLVPIPSANGSLSYYTVDTTTALGAADTALPIPAIFTPYIKWGVIADMLKKEGEANDPERSAYAEGRFQEGIELARLMLGVE